MPREIPDCPKKPIPSVEAGRSYEIDLITPMFGGGVEPRVNDPSFPIRPTAIRGQLQFWWRATVGAQYATVAELRDEHSAIWGSTKRASRVQVLVENVQASKPAPCAQYTARGDGKLKLNWNSAFAGPQNALPYALFPFQGQLSKDRKRVDEQPAPYIAKASFRLILRCPHDQWPQVEPAVWAWLNFGGLGSRTRRGCGSLYCKDFAPAGIGSLAAWYRRPNLASAAGQSWPTIRAIPLVRDEAQDPLTVWERMIGMYRYFRQGEGFARNDGPGRSRYPEPETIRRITRRRMKKHVPWDDVPDGFPRAEFGLPIVFHFKDDDRGEPPATTLYPFVDGKALERMASPLIFKPLAIARDSAVPMIVCLHTPGVDRVELHDENKTCRTPRHAVPVRSPKFTARGSPLHGLSDVGSVFTAFLAFARGGGFAEVSR